LQGGRGTAGGTPVAAGPPALPTNDFLFPRLILIGTVHGDPQGYPRALTLLDYFCPDLITVEISPFSLRYRRRQGPRWQRLLGQALQELPPEAAGHLALRRLAAQVTLPFEVQAARDWGRRHEIPWRPLDVGAPSRRHLPRYARELLAPANLKALLDNGPDGSLEDLVAGEFCRARRAYQRAPRRLPTAGEVAAARREQVMARRLRRLTDRGGRVVHLGGWEHLVPWQDGGGLWHGVADLQPLRLLLDEAEVDPGACDEGLATAPW
jgi:hypothetical protein